jgi:hypothetical protein
MEDFERIVEDLHKDANLKFAHEYEVKKVDKLNVLPHVNLTLLLETTVLEYDQRKRDQQ